MDSTKIVGEKIKSLRETKENTVWPNWPYALALPKNK